MAATTLINGVSVAARSTQTGSEAISSVSQGIAVTLKVQPSGDTSQGSLVLQAQYSVDGTNYSDLVDTGLSVSPNADTQTRYALVSAPAGVSVKLQVVNASDMAVTVTLIALPA